MFIMRSYQQLYLRVRTNFNINKNFSPHSPRCVCTELNFNYQVNKTAIIMCKACKRYRVLSVLL